MKTKNMKIIGIVLFVFAISNLLTGFYKKSIYDSTSYETVNVYVGGDAYNYIINGTYFTGHAVLGAGFGVAGTLFFLSGTVIEKFDGTPDLTTLKFESLQTKNKNDLYGSDEELFKF